MYQRILVPIDGSEASVAGLDEAVELAKATGGKIKLLHVINKISSMGEMQPDLSGEWISAIRTEGAELLKRASLSVQADGVEVESVVLDGFTAALHELVTGEAIRWKADLIMLGTHGRRGFKRLFFGSDAESIVRHSPIPILLVRHSSENFDFEFLSGNKQISSHEHSID